MNIPNNSDYSTGYSGYSNSPYGGWNRDLYDPPGGGSSSGFAEDAYRVSRRSPDPAPFAMPEAWVPESRNGAYAANDWGPMQPTVSFPSPVRRMAPEPYYDPPASFPAPSFNVELPITSPAYGNYAQIESAAEPPELDALASTFQRTSFMQEPSHGPPPALLRSPSPYSSSSSSAPSTRQASLYSRRPSSNSTSPSEQSDKYPERHVPAVQLTWTPAEAEEDALSTSDVQSAHTPASPISPISSASPPAPSPLLDAAMPAGDARSRASSFASSTSKPNLVHSLSFRKSPKVIKASSSIAHLLAPAPPPFERPPKEGLQYEDCAPISLFSTSTRLEEGFPAVLPPVLEIGEMDAPHPFTTHDVTEGDWLLFLLNVKTAASGPSFGKALASSTSSMAKGVSRVAGELLIGPRVVALI